MSLVSRTVAFIRNFARRERIESDLDAELQAYVAALTAEKMRAGLAPADAARLAKREAGTMDGIKEAVRDARAGATVDVLLRDLRFAARGLVHAPVFSLTAVFALALGIGATTAILSVVNAVLLRPLPYANAGQLVVILNKGRNPIAPANFLDWRRQNHSFTDMAAAESWSPNLTGTDEPEHLAAMRITASLLPMLGVPPLLGRTIAADEDHDGRDRVTVISYGIWQRRFAGDSAVIGRQVLLDGNPYTIVGVMPPAFQFAPFWVTHAELWAPLSLDTRSAQRSAASLRIFARRRSGTTLEQARADLAVLTAQLELQFPGTNRDMVVTPLKDKVVGDVRSPLLVLLAAVAFVLLTACANVAHMMLARAGARHRELAVRTALGATRRRLITQLLTESAMLAAAGGAAGLLLAWLGIRSLAAASTTAAGILPRVATVSIDGRVVLLAVAVTAATTVVFGLLPALRATAVNLTDAFKDGDRGASEGRGPVRLRSTLVGSEVALALVLLVGAVLMIRSVIALQRIDPGFDPHGVTTMIVSTLGTREAAHDVHPLFFAEALGRIRAIPGVQSASFINHLPIAGDEWGFPFAVEGRPKPKPGESPTATYRVVFPDYFHTMRIPLLHGRDVATADRLGTTPVVVINEFMANTYWPGEDAIGKRITLDDSTWVTVVGVVKNTVREDWSRLPEEEMFLPFFQQPAFLAGGGAVGYMTLVARISCRQEPCDATGLVVPIVAAIRGIDRNLPVSAVQTMSTVVEGATAESRFLFALLGGFAAIALALAAIGIYGVMSYSVSRRTHEIGIRIALGAAPATVLGQIVRQGMTVTLVGAGAGIVAALALTRLMGNLLYGVGPTDPLTFGVVTGVMGTVALAATTLPAWRATRIDPLVALRSD
jgi:predicted permease